MNDAKVKPARGKPKAKAQRPRNREAHAADRAAGAAAARAAEEEARRSARAAEAAAQQRLIDEALEQRRLVCICAPVHRPFRQQSRSSDSHITIFPHSNQHEILLVGLARACALHLHSRKLTCPPFFRQK